MAHHIKMLKNSKEGQIYNFIVAMISVMLRSLRQMYNAIFCYYNFQFPREDDN